MMIDNVSQKIQAIKIAEDCIHSIRTINPDSVDQQVFAILSDLKMDLIDHMDAQSDELQNWFKKS